MKKTISIFFLFACLQTGAQDKDFNFIRHASITWAADVSAAYQFNTPNISLALRQQLAAGKIKAFIPDENNQNTKATADAVRQRIAPDRIMQVADNKGNVVGTIMEADDPLFSARYFNEQTKNAVLLKQLLYIKDGLLKIYVPAASPKYSVVTSWGEALGQAPAFSTASNKCRKIPRSRARFAKFDSATSIVLNLDTVRNAAMVKQLYGQNLLQALWPNFNKKQYQFFVGNSQAPVSFSLLNMGIINGDANIKVPVYDANGNITAYTEAPPVPLDLTLFSKVEIIPVVYFNEKKNRFYSEPGELVFYARKWQNGVLELLPSPALTVKINRH